jgi:hypothetical protein
MIARITVIWVTLVAAVALAAAGAAVCAGSPQQGPGPAPKAAVEPDPKLQDLIRRTVSRPGRPLAEQEDAFYAGLRAMRTMPPEKLAPQLVYFAAKEEGKLGEAAGWAVIELLRLRFAQGPYDFFLALVPLLDSDDEKIRELAAAYFDYACLAHLNLSPGMGPGGGAYYRDLAPALRGKEAAPPRGLVRHLYTYPDVGLRTMVEHYLPEGAPDRKPVLWGQHVIADTLWRQQHGFLENGRVDPAAAEQADKLSRHDRWWVRLYVAAVLRDRPAFRTKALVDRLQRDSNEMVKQTVKDFLNAREEPGPQP